MSEANHVTPEFSSERLWSLGVFVEGGLAVVAIVLAWFGLFDPNQPISDWGADFQLTLFWGLLATLPMFVYLAVFHWCPPRAMMPMRRFVDQTMRPMFRDSSLFQLAVLSLLAGFCEELLFRWSLQGGLAAAIGGDVGIWVSLVIVSVLFGLAHWVNASYGVSTALIGIYLGATMIFSGSFLVPAIAHTIFDLVALVYIARWSPPDFDAGQS